MNILTDNDTSSLSAQFLHNRYILTIVGEQQLAFPSHWVAEIILVERSRVLALPFYGPMLLGIVHHQSAIVPLMSSHLVLSEKLSQSGHAPLMKETLSVILLGPSVGKQAGIGLVVERVIGSVSEEQIFAAESTILRLELQDIPNRVWQPQRWSSITTR